MGRIIKNRPACCLKFLLEIIIGQVLMAGWSPHSFFPSLSTCWYAQNRSTPCPILICAGCAPPLCAPFQFSVRSKAERTLHLNRGQTGKNITSALFRIAAINPHSCSLSPGRIAFWLSKNQSAHYQMPGYLISNTKSPDP